MTKTLSFVAAAMLCAIATQSFGQNGGFQPVTNDVLANPPPGAPQPPILPTPTGAPRFTNRSCGRSMGQICSIKPGPCSTSC